MDRSTKRRGNRIPYGTPETFHSIQISFLKTSFDRIPWRSSRAFDNQEAFCDRAWSTGTLVCPVAIRFVEQSAVRLFEYISIQGENGRCENEELEQMRKQKSRVMILILVLI